MTKREFYEAVKAIEGVSDELVAKADELIAGLDKGSSKPTKTQVENEGHKVTILDWLKTNAGSHTAAQVADGTGILKGRVVALLGQLATAGQVTITEGKGKAPKSYAAAGENGSE